MTDETDLGDAFEEATTAAERAHAERDGDSLPADERESLRESTGRLADAASAASVAELLDAAGFEDVSDDVSPVDLPAVIADADAAAIVELRRLLRLADLGESWSDLSDGERTDRLDRVVGDDGEGDGGFAQLKEYLDQFGHLGDGESEADGDTDDADASNGESETEDETDADVDDGDADDGENEYESDDDDAGLIDSLTDDGASDDGDAGVVDALTDDESDGGDSDGEESSDAGGEDDELLELEDHVDRLRAMFADDGEDEAGDGDETGDDDDADDGDGGLLGDDDEDDEDDEFADDADRSRSTAGSSRLSTVPSSRSDVGSSTGFSTVRGKD